MRMLIFFVAVLALLATPELAPFPGINYLGIASMAGTMGALVLQFLVFIRQGRADKKLNVLHTLTNGMAHELDTANKQVAFGKGVDAERFRDNPPATPAPAPPPAPPAPVADPTLKWPK